MIHDLDETIKQVLLKQGKLNASDVDIVFDQPTGEWAASLSRPTINLYLYDIRENTELRPPRHRNVEQNGRTARITFAPKRIELSYLITVWARNPEDEHQLLWRVLRTLSQLKIIKPEEEGVGLVRNQPMNMPIKVALPTDAMRNLTDLWGVMENQLKPSINFTITTALDLDEVIDSPMVLTTITRVGQADPPTERLIAQDTERYHIGGRVLDKDVPLSSIAEVILLDRGDRIETDSASQFMFPSILPGDYELEVVTEDRKPKRFKITVPSETYDLSL